AAFLPELPSLLGLDRCNRADVVGHVDDAGVVHERRMYGAPVCTCHTTCDVEMSPCPPGRIAMYGPLRYPRLRYTTPSWNVGDGIGNWFVPPTCHKNAPVFGTNGS